MTACCGLALMVGSPSLARADSQDDDTDARLGGYSGENVKLEKGGVAFPWMLFVALSVVGAAAMCKNANRSHLD